MIKREKGFDPVTDPDVQRSGGGGGGGAPSQPDPEIGGSPI